MEKNTRMLFFGVLTWLVPFVFSWPFYDQDGEPVIDLITIKTIMMVVFGAFGALLLVLYFRALEGEYLKEGITVGIVWLVINWVLDAMFLVGAFGFDILRLFDWIP